MPMKCLQWKPPPGPNYPDETDFITVTQPGRKRGTSVLFSGTELFPNMNDDNIAWLRIFQK